MSELSDLRSEITQIGTMRYGRTRNLRARDAVERAEAAGDDSTLVAALLEVLSAQAMGGEGDANLVPFARLIRLWDESPAAFTPQDRHRLFWAFKWVTSGMILHPNVPLGTIRDWLRQMGERYRQAGFGLHAVHKARLEVARHLGDLDAVAAAFADWRATERDRMSDCAACDGQAMGSTFALLGDDEAAIAAWEPVIGGSLRCVEEPQFTLSTSLLPLVRIGRDAQARNHHLRGYRMTRGDVNLFVAIGQHLEFAALTGNEPRGIEMLRDHQQWLTPGAEDLISRARFYEGAAMLLRRLDDLGHGHLEILSVGDAGPGDAPAGTTVSSLRARLEGEIADIEGRFDQRNGSTATSEASRRRLDTQPIGRTISLGTGRVVLSAGPAPVTPPPAAAPVSHERSSAQVQAEAERLASLGDPGARSAWKELAALPGAPGWAELKVTEHDVLTQLREGRLTEPRTLFTGLAAEFTAAGAPGWGLVNASRSALVASLTGDPATGEREFAEVIAQVRALPADQADGGRHLLRVRQAQAQAQLAIALGSGPAELTAVRAVFGDLMDQAAELGDVVRIAHLRALDSTAATEPAEREDLRRQAVAGLVQSGAVWSAVEMLEGFAVQHHQAGAPEPAATYAREALHHAADLDGPEQTGRLHALLAEILLAGGPEAADEASDHALIAADLLSGINPLRAAWCRVTAAQALRASGRVGEALALVDFALPVIERDGDDRSRVQAQQWAGECAFDAGEFRSAATLFLGAAQTAAGWPDQAAHAELAHQAGMALDKAGLPDDSISSYDRAAELHAANGALVLQVRARRAAAWVAAQRQEGTLTDGLDRMAAAAELLRQAPQEPQVQYEYVSTRLQEAELILDWLSGLLDDETGDDRTVAQLARRAVAASDDVVAAVSAGAPSGRVDRPVHAQAQMVAAQIEALFLHDPQQAHARVAEAAAAAAADGDETTVATYQRFVTWLDDELAL